MAARHLQPDTSAGHNTAEVTTAAASAAAASGTTTTTTTDTSTAGAVIEMVVQIAAAGGATAAISRTVAGRPWNTAAFALVAGRACEGSWAAR